MNESGSSQNTSTRVDVIPSFAGLSQPLLAGCPRKNGAPPISRPATDPRLHNTFASSARLYHSTADDVSSTASITDRVSPCIRISFYWKSYLIIGRGATWRATILNPARLKVET